MHASSPGSARVPVRIVPINQAWGAGGTRIHRIGTPCIAVSVLGNKPRRSAATSVRLVVHRLGLVTTTVTMGNVPIGRPMLVSAAVRKGRLAC